MSDVSALLSDQFGITVNLPLSELPPGSVATFSGNLEAPPRIKRGSLTVASKRISRLPREPKLIFNELVKGPIIPDRLW